MNQKKYWDSVANDKEFTTPFHYEELSKYINTGSVILDVGCGYGRTMNDLWSKGYHYLIGIDFSDQMIKRGQTLYPLLDLRVQFDKNICLENNSVDVVILFAVLTCIIDYNEQKYLIDEIKRVLKPNGIIYVNDFLLNDDERNLKRYDKYKNKHSYGVFELEEGAVLRHHSLEYIKKLLSQFEECNLESVEYTTMNGNKSNGFYFIGRNT
jgi:ubiquinone/menaquinone biosynthesis C-methylase UbiE